MPGQIITGFRMSSNAENAESGELFSLCRTSPYRYFMSDGLSTKIDDQLHTLLSNGIDPNLRYEGSTPLCEASRRGNERIAKLLLHYGASVDMKDDGGNTPLHLAAYYGRLQVAELLLTFGAEINCRNNHGFPPLLCSLINGNNSCKDVARLLTDQGAQVNILHRGEPLIKFLLSNGTDLEMVDLILDAGVSPYHQYNLISLDRRALDKLQGQIDWQCYVRKLVISGFRISLMANIVFDFQQLGFDSFLDKPEVKDLLNYLQLTRSKVPRLERLCRPRIRHELAFSISSGHIRHKIDILPLPEQMKAFLKLDQL